MKFILAGISLLGTVCMPPPRQNLTIQVVAANDNTSLPAATVTWLDGLQSLVADSAGSVLFTGLSEGPQRFRISHAGFVEKDTTLMLPIPAPGIVRIMLMNAQEEEEEEEVIVQSTRSSRTIANLPTRIEVISGEELGEKGNMKPGDIRMLLNESTGIQTQQTSATSYNAGIRIQGLDGRYTQLLRDGYPNYSGFSGGLSLLQIAPLDLQQVEVIKGAASTLYGGGAIAGLVNLISKTPGDERAIDLLVNGTTAGGLDLSAFYRERFSNWGMTLFAARNSGRAYDPADIGLTAIPQFERYTLNPRVFYYGKKASIDVGVLLTSEDRLGGSLNYIRRGGSGFFEDNHTRRVTVQAGWTQQLSEASTFQWKQSYSRFRRSIALRNYRFDGLQKAVFSELSWRNRRGKSEWIVGLNYQLDDLEELSVTTTTGRDYRLQTIGLFAQQVWELSDKIQLETGLRGDHTDPFGFEWLPRVSALWRIHPSLSTRLGAGLGYKSPSIFTEEAERRQFQQVLPVNTAATRNERSAGANWDINYSTRLGEWGISINQLFYYTRLNQPLVLQGNGSGEFSFENADGFLDTRRCETNLRILYRDFKLFVGYTFTDANTHFGSSERLPLTARHRLNNVLMYEVEEKWKIGLEAYYYSPQRLSDGTTGRSYWITGLMAEKLWEKFSVFINFENFTDTRQTSFGPIYSGTLDQPVFTDIYAPLDGFVVNGGFKLRF